MFVFWNREALRIPKTALAISEDTSLLQLTKHMYLRKQPYPSSVYRRLRNKQTKHESKWAPAAASRQNMTAANPQVANNPQNDKWMHMRRHDDDEQVRVATVADGCFASAQFH